VYRVALELDLLPALADAVLPPHGTPSRPAPPVDAPAHPYIPSKPHTGLLVDARGLGLAPGLAPRILDDEGTLVYSASGVDRQYAARIGVVGYDRDLERARHSERLGGASARPLELKAKEVAGANRADVVLTREDGIRARMADMEGHFLSECRVVFVVGPAATEGK
jgi:hypothetical protein